MNSFKTFGATKINDDMYLTLIGSLAQIVNGCMRIFWSSLLDFHSFKRVNSALLLIQASCIFFFELSANNKGSFMLMVCLAMMTEGAVAAIVPTITLQKFGLTRGHDVYSYMFSAFGMSALFGSVIVRLFEDIIGFRGLLGVSLVLTCSAFLLSLKLDTTHLFDYEKLRKHDETSYTQHKAEHSGEEDHQSNNHVTHHEESPDEKC